MVRACRRVLQVGAARGAGERNSNPSVQRRPAVAFWSRTTDRRVNPAPDLQNEGGDRLPYQPGGTAKPGTEPNLKRHFEGGGCLWPEPPVVLEPRRGLGWPRLNQRRKYMGSFTNQKPQIATKEHLTANWGGGKPGDRFRCCICGYKFILGDYWRWVYTNDIAGAGGNPLICQNCDGPDVRERWIEMYRVFREEITPKYWHFIPDCTLCEW